MGEFKSWLKLTEYANFGFETKKEQPKPDLDDKPTHLLDLKHIIEDLKNQKLGLKEADNRFFSELQWGDHPGAVKLTFSPAGGLRATIHQLTTDLRGQPRWISKKVIEVKNNYDTKPDSLIETIRKDLLEIDKENIPSPSEDFKKLENLVVDLASSLKKSIKKLFIYEGIKRLVPHEHYIIHFSCTGTGLQRRNQKRLDQFQVEVYYDKKAGTIRITGNDLGDKISKHSWKLEPSEFNEFFTPSQPSKDIIDVIKTHVSCY